MYRRHWNDIMLKSIFAAVIIATTISCAGTAFAQHVDYGSPATSPGFEGLVDTKEGVDYAKIEIYRRKIKALRISYPWRQYADASIELRLVTSPDADPREINPLHFIGDLMRGKVIVDVTSARTGAFSSGSTKPLKVRGMDFSIRGKRNLTGRPSVHLVTQFENDQPAPGTVAIYPYLEDWATGATELFIDVPKEEFVKRGELHIWFMRGGKALWHQKLWWPGYADAGKPLSQLEPMP